MVIFNTFFYKLLSMFITALIVLYFFYKKIKQFTTNDPSPTLLAISSSNATHASNSLIVVTMGLYIENFMKFNVIENNFIADIVIWFQYNPSLVTLATIESFSFDKGEILQKPAPDIKMVDGDIFVQYAVRLSFSSNLNYQGFPLEGHRLFIVFENKTVDPKDIVFVATHSGFSWTKDMYMADWLPIAASVQPGYAIEQFDKADTRYAVNFPRVVFSIDVARRGLKNTILILIPIVLIFYIGFFSFILDPFQEDDIHLIQALTLSSLPGLVAYSFILATVSPKVGYFTLSDRFYILFLIAAFIVTLLHVYMVQLHEPMDIVYTVRNIAFFSIQLIIIAFSYRLIFYTTDKSEQVSS